MKRVLITSDFLMTKEKEQFSNLRWLRDLLTPTIKYATGIEPEMFTSTLTDRNELISRVKFFELSGIECDIEATQFYYDDKAISDASVQYLKQFITEGDLVVAYELAEQTRRLLEAIGVTYIDIWLHPVRFMDDILFGFSSNNQEIFDRLTNYHMSEDMFRLYGNMHKISAYKGWKRYLDNVKIVKDSALFIGQTLEDKAVCKDGKMMNVLDFKNEFEAAGRKYGKVYYSRHPYVKQGDKEIMDYLKKCEFAQVIQTPAYHLLASPNLSYVFSISSSVVFEAKYYGKEADFLYQPVIELTTEPGIRSYCSVFQDFVSPHFWADILSPVMETRDSPEILFSDKKDKLRDMLAFYWSYKELDKVEASRMTLRAVDGRVQKLDKQINKPKAAAKKPAVPAPAKPNYVDPEKFFSEASALIDDHEVVSFDIFDTLLVRPFATPNAMFNMIEDEAKAIIGDQSIDFRALREAARGMVKEPKLAEEVNLDERYEALTGEMGWKKSVAKKLTDLELSTELSVCYRREFAKRLYDYAIQKGKKVIITSDIFMSYEFIEDLLRKNGYVDHHILITSSKEGVLKHSGNLFPILIEKSGVQASKILHIGDNRHSDIKRGEEHGVTTLLLERTFEAYTSQSRVAKSLKFDDMLTDSIVKGIIANKMADNPKSISTPSHANGKADSVGFSLLGPMFFGAAKWLRDTAANDGVDELFFLSRDGEILKRTYDLIADKIGGPKSNYVYASRRSVNVASIRSVEDAKALVDTNFSPCDTHVVLRNRFGIELDEQDRKKLTENPDAAKADERIFYKDANALNRLKVAIEVLAEKILGQAEFERTALLDYYKASGLSSADKKIAIVDIGHAGSIQESLSRILGIEDLGGYYFASFGAMRDRFEGTDLWYDAYLGTAIDEIKPAHPYKENILMFELAFLNAETSFVRMHKLDDGTFRPEMLPEELEAGRIPFAKELHHGAVEFAEVVCETLGRHIDKINIRPLDAIRGYNRMVINPTLVDMDPFMGISFENSYSCRDSSFVIREGAANEVPTGLWTAAVETLAANKEPQLGWRQKVLNDVILGLTGRGVISEKKYNKFVKDPRAFFGDSRSRLIRLIGNIAGV